MKYYYHQNDQIPSELVFGIVGTIGCNKEGVIEAIDGCAMQYGYKTVTINISDIIRDLFLIHGNLSRFNQIKLMMKKGLKIRKETNSNSVLINLAVEKIRAIRKEYPAKKRIFIIDSIKHPDEVDELRAIYPQGFYLFAVHVNKTDQTNFLRFNCNIKVEKEINELIRMDRYDHTPYGQNTSRAFHLADFFINQKDYYKFGVQKAGKLKLTNVITRFFEIIFGHPYKTPTFDEYAMFMAYASSARSADMSRHVGAVICQDDNIISTGSNDCPKYGGGVYSPLYNNAKGIIYDFNKGRDYMRGIEYNAYMKDEMIEKISNNITGDAEKQLKMNIKSSGIYDLTEFGRAVHAEMEALLSCARRNVDTMMAKMYCTTFPCHNCARHIVASGIDQVYYIEPYPKSKAIEMHNESITDSYRDWNKSKRTNINKVLFRPFIGVGPRLFMNFFSMNLTIGSKYVKTKDGKTVKWLKKKSLPKMKMIPLNYLEREQSASACAYDKLYLVRKKINYKEKSAILFRIKNRSEEKLNSEIKRLQKQFLEYK